MDVFGLDSCSKRVEFEKAVRLTQSSGRSMPSNSAGAVYSALYLERVKPLYDLHWAVKHGTAFVFDGTIFESAEDFGSWRWLHIYIFIAGTSR